MTKLCPTVGTLPMVGCADLMKIVPMGSATKMGTGI